MYPDLGVEMQQRLEIAEAQMVAAAAVTVFKSDGVVGGSGHVQVPLQVSHELLLLCLFDILFCLLISELHVFHLRPCAQTLTSSWE
jgi:hypothetical protein